MLLFLVSFAVLTDIVQNKGAARSMQDSPALMLANCCLLARLDAAWGLNLRMGNASTAVHCNERIWLSYLPALMASQAIEKAIYYVAAPDLFKVFCQF